jgi:type IV pilus assembly protein PilB
MGKSNGNGVRDLGFLDDAELARMLSARYRVPLVELDEYEVPRTVLDLVPRELCERFVVLPVSMAGRSLIVAMADPTNQSAVDALVTETGYAVEPVIATEAGVRAASVKYYGPIARSPR